MHARAAKCPGGAARSAQMCSGDGMMVTGAAGGDQQARFSGTTPYGTTCSTTPWVGRSPPSASLHSALGLMSHAASRSKPSRACARARTHARKPDKQTRTSKGLGGGLAKAAGLGVPQSTRPAGSLGRGSSSLTGAVAAAWQLANTWLAAKHAAPALAPCPPQPIGLGRRPRHCAHMPAPCHAATLHLPPPLHLPLLASTPIH